MRTSIELYYLEREAHLIRLFTPFLSPAQASFCLEQLAAALADINRHFGLPPPPDPVATPSSRHPAAPTTTEANAPILPRDCVLVNEAGRGTNCAPRDKGPLYVINCWKNPAYRHHQSKGNWLVSIVGKRGFKPRGKEHTGAYNAGLFDLVRREPSQRSATDDTSTPATA